MHDAIIVGEGLLGGKAKGYLKAKDHLQSPAVRDASPSLSRILKFPKTACVSTDCFNEFVKINNLGRLIEHHKWDHDKAYEVLRRHFLKGIFPELAKNQLRKILQEMDYPLAVRSSSMLEDRPGTSFAGKYTTIFINNRGPLEVRLETLCQAIKEVYASTFNPNALSYRKVHGILDETEQMAILLQQAIGREYQGYFLPIMAGVGFSLNGFTWAPEIKKEEGIVRMVFGLGTRAVGRGYARIFSPKKPMVRPEGSDASDITRFSQGWVDVLDLEKNQIKEIRFEEIVKDGMNCYPRAQKLFSLKDDKFLYVPSTNLWDIHHKPVLTFEAILAYPWLGLDLPKMMDWLFRELEGAMHCPVDIEFAVRVSDDSEVAELYLLQCRPLSQREDLKPKPIPTVPDSEKIFYATKKVPTGSLGDIEYIIYVDPHLYKTWPTADRASVARVVGKLNRALDGKNFILIGPGRWGTTNAELGVTVKYGEIANAKMLVEVAIPDADYVPEVSYGSHFFQDLIEQGCLYTPLYLDGTAFLNEAFFKRASVFHDLLPHKYFSQYAELIRVIHVPTVTGGHLASAIFDGEKEKGLLFIEPMKDLYF